MLRIRIKFTKMGNMKFISHLDLFRMMERALRRNDVPLAFSQGFNPHPKISFATALALGVSSEGEYMDIEIEEEIDLARFKEELNHVLPQGIRIIECSYIGLKCKALMAAIDFSTYIVKGSLEREVNVETFKRNMADLLNRQEILVSKKNKKEVHKELNIRPLIHSVEVIDMENDHYTLKMILSTGSRGNLKPEIFMEKFKELTEIPFILDKVRVHRVDLYAINEDRFVTPLEMTT